MKEPLVASAMMTSFLLSVLLVPAQVMATDLADTHENHWFVFGGVMNYHLRLEESERQIDARINSVFEKLICGWNEPQTFKDWSDDWLLWDPFVGFGRDISPRWSWGVDVGGGMGTVKNRDTYHPLGLRLKSNIDFTRKAVYVEGIIDYYPWGKPVMRRREFSGSGMMNTLRGAKPYLSAVAGYTRMTAEAEVSLRVPVLGKILHQKQEDTYDLFYVCPRVSVEMPVTRNGFLNVTVGYAFFSDHPREFNSICTGVFWKHRF